MNEDRNLKACTYVFIILVCCICNAKHRHETQTLSLGGVVTCDNLWILLFSVFTLTPPMCHYSQKPHRFRIKFRELPLLFSALVSSFVFLLVKKKITATCSKSSLCLVFWCAKVATNKTPHTDGGDLVFPMALTPPHTHTHTLFYILCFL